MQFMIALGTLACSFRICWLLVTGDEPKRRL
jgi:hypothetical protein